MKKVIVDNKNESITVEVKDTKETITLARGYNTIMDMLNNAERYAYLVKELEGLLERERLIKKNKQQKQDPK